MGFYIYGVVKTNAVRKFGEIGLSEKPVYSIGIGGIAFVVSEAVLSEYIANALNLGEHERVLETIMRESTILPMRFGTVADSEKELLLMLKKHSNSFLRMFKKLSRRVEVKVEILWRDMKTIFAEIASANPKLKQLKAQTMSQSRNDVIMAGQMVYQLLQDEKKRITEGLMKRLRRFSVDYVLNPCMTDELIMNGAFLIEMTKLNEFERALDLIDKEIGEIMRVRCIGPLPPYSFINMRAR